MQFIVIEPTKQTKKNSWNDGQSGACNHQVW